MVWFELLVVGVRVGGYGVWHRYGNVRRPKGWHGWLGRGGGMGRLCGHYLAFSRGRVPVS